MDQASAHRDATPGRIEIAHVLFMDIVGYSRLPMDEQKKLLDELQEVVRGTDAFRNPSGYGERLTLPTGDGIALVFFGSPEDPLETAVQVSTALRARPHLQLRLGVHTGPVYRVADINANRNVAGGGINIAQRVMDCGDAGHILVSDAMVAALGQLKIWSDRLHDLGTIEVKHGVPVHIYNLFDDGFGNPQAPSKNHGHNADLRRHRFHPSRWAALIVVLIAVAATAWALWGGRLGGMHFGNGGDQESRRMVAVLPFETIAAEPGRNYFAAGMSEEIMAQLSKLSALHVLSRMAVAKYAADVAHTPKWSDLGVGSLVMGSVREDRSDVRIHVQLVDARSNETLWADEFDRSREDVLRVQTDVARQVATALHVTLAPADTARLGRVSTQNPAAYELFLKSVRVAGPGDQGSTPGLAANDEAIALLNQAVSLDPQFATALAVLARRYGFKAAFQDPKYLTTALEKARQAVDLDPSSGRAHHALGVTLSRMGQLSQARDSLIRATSLEPSFTDALADLSVAEGQLGHYDRALESARKFFVLAPNLPAAYFHMGGALSSFSDDEVTEQWLIEAERRLPRYSRIGRLRAIFDFMRGDEAKAVARLREWVAAEPNNEETKGTFTEIAALTGAPEGDALLEARFRAAPDVPSGGVLWESVRLVYAWRLIERGDSRAAAALITDSITSAEREIGRGVELSDLRIELAAAYALRGDKQRALDWLERAYAAGWRDDRGLARDPLLASLRDEPKYRALLERTKVDVAEMSRRVDLHANPPIPPMSVFAKQP